MRIVVKVAVELEIRDALAMVIERKLLGETR